MIFKNVQKLIVFVALLNYLQNLQLFSNHKKKKKQQQSPWGK